MLPTIAGVGVINSIIIKHILKDKIWNFSLPMSFMSVDYSFACVFFIDVGNTFLLQKNKVFVDYRPQYF